MPGGGERGHLMRRSASSGLSLIEMVVTVSVAAILLSVAMPGLRTMIQNNRVAADTNVLVGSLNYARSEALTRGLPVSICASSNGTSCAGSANWAGGWIVFTDDAGTAGTLDGTDALIRSYPTL